MIHVSAVSAKKKAISAAKIRRFHQVLLHQPVLSLAPQMAGEVAPVEEVTEVARPSPSSDRPTATGIHQHPWRCI
ncbi:unnamed protein product [Ilex paraguariensis]|uniref:Uncharacterized protein n=1 Tax=Ilex paraguariensis TaxID=185542 RepID=A0ABC8TK91_9AQUA